MCELVVAAADQEVDLAVGEDVLGLQQLAGVALVEEIVDAISVHPHAPRGGPASAISLVILKLILIPRTNRHLITEQSVRLLDGIVHGVPLLHGELVRAEGRGEHAAAQPGAVPRRRAVAGHLHLLPRLGPRPLASRHCCHARGLF